MDLINQILASLQGFGSMAEPLKIAAIITAVLSLWKSSLLQPLWAKLGAAQVLVAPVLGAVIAVLQLPGGPTVHNIWVGLSTGMLSIALHELIAAIELLPGIGPKYKAVLDFIDGLLQQPAAVAKMKAVKAAASKKAEEKKEDEKKKEEKAEEKK